MRLLASFRDGLLAALALVGALAVLAMMLHVVGDVLSRSLANRPIPATYEIVTNYYMIALAFVPLAWVERGGGMIQVEAMEPFMNRRMIRLSDIVVALLSTVVYWSLAWFTGKTALQNFEIGTFAMAQSVRVPTWPAFFLLPIGFFLAGLVTLSRIAVPQKALTDER